MIPRVQLFWERGSEWSEVSANARYLKDIAFPEFGFFPLREWTLGTYINPRLKEASSQTSEAVLEDYNVFRT